MSLVLTSAGGTPADSRQTPQLARTVLFSLPLQQEATMIKSLNKISAICVLALPLAIAAPASAATTISSSAYGLGATLSAVDAVLVNVGPLVQAGGTAAPAYNNSANLVSIDQDLVLGGFGPLLTVRERLQTGIVTSTASSPFPVTPTGTASSSINDLNVALTTKLLAVPVVTLLGLSADTIVSTSSVSGVGGLSAVGSTTIEGLDLTGLGLGGLFIDGSLYINPDPNTVLLN
ncbi:MAG: hypothetical protein ACREB5_07290, partial [Sphingomonadaceae bacterium]